MIKANKIDVLEFIKERGMIEPWELRDHFGYTDHSAADRLRRLKNQGLVINMTRGMWELTVDGFARLRYYGRR